MPSGYIEHDRTRTDLIHGKDSTYNIHDCRCQDCARAHRYAIAEQRSWTPHGEWFDRDWVVMNLPIAVIMRQAFTDAEAIAAVQTLP